MPVKRRLDKRNAHRLTPAAVDAFREAIATRATFEACHRREACAAETAHDRCADCLRHIFALSALQRVLGLLPCQPTPLDTEADAPPDWCGPHDAWADSWALVRGLRVELEAIDD